MAFAENTAWKQLASAIARLEAEQAGLRCSVATFRSTLGELDATIGELGSNLDRFNGALETVRVGAGKLGAKSRKLAATMDGYLAKHGGPVEAAAPAPQPLRAAWTRAA